MSFCPGCKKGVEACKCEPEGLAERFRRAHAERLVALNKAIDDSFWRGVDSRVYGESYGASYGASYWTVKGKLDGGQ